MVQPPDPLQTYGIREDGYDLYQKLVIAGWGLQYKECFPGQVHSEGWKFFRETGLHQVLSDEEAA